MAKTKKAIIALIIVLLITIPSVYFGFINDKTYVALRMWMADQQMEKENYDRAETLYNKVIGRDDQQVDAYLKLAEICFAEKRYADAVTLLKRAYEVTDGDKDLVPVLAEALNLWAEELIEDGDPKQAIELLEKNGGKYLPVKELTDMLSQAYLARAGQIRDAGELKEALSFVESADPEKVDYEVFRQFRIEGYGSLGAEALEADDIAAAKQYYNMVLLLDPENEEAKAILDSLMEEEEETAKSFRVRGDGVINIAAVVYGAFRVEIPVNIDLFAEYEGEDPDGAILHYRAVAEIDLMGQKQQMYHEAYYIEQESGLQKFERSNANGMWTFATESGTISGVTEEIFNNYLEMAKEGTADTNTSIMKDQQCKVIHDHKGAEDYLNLLSGADPGELLELIGGLDANVVRYIALSDDRVLYAEADLSQSDFSPLLNMANDYTGGLDAEMSVSECRIHLDVDAVNATDVVIPQEVTENALGYYGF